MTEAERKRLIERFIAGELSPGAIAQFRELLALDPALRESFQMELELRKSLDPDGEYQQFKAQLVKVSGEFFGDGESDMSA